MISGVLPRWEDTSMLESIAYTETAMLCVGNRGRLWHWSYFYFVPGGQMRSVQGVEYNKLDAQNACYANGVMVEHGIDPGNHCVSQYCTEDGWFDQ